MQPQNIAGLPKRLLSALGDRRLGPVLMTTGAGWVSRFATAIAQFAAIRLLTDRLGVDGYSAFAVITGLLAWFMLADLGFGFAIQNHISHSRVDGLAWEPVVRRALAQLGRWLIVIWLAIAALAPLAGPYLLADYHSVSATEATLAFTASGTLLSATGALSILLKIQFAEHRGYVAHLVTGGSAVAGLALLAVLLSFHVDHMLVWAIIAYYVPGVVLPLFLLARLCRMLHQTAALPDSLQRQSRRFLLFAALSALVLNVDYIILARAVRADQLLIYAIINKVYALIFILYNSILQAYWPVIAEALRRGDIVAVRVSIRRCMAVGCAIVLGGTLAFIAAADWITALLAPVEHPIIPVFLVLLYAGYWLLRVWTDVFGIIIMSSGQVGYLCRIVSLQAAVSVPSAYVGAMLFGVPGLIVGFSVGYLATVAWIMPRHVLRYLETSSKAAE